MVLVLFFSKLYRKSEICPDFRNKVRAVPRALLAIPRFRSDAWPHWWVAEDRSPLIRVPGSVGLRSATDRFAKRLVVFTEH